MSEFKGTPGPWFEYREGFSTVYIEARLRDGVIQEVAACGPTEAGQESQAANAKLIAAAPELLEALERIIICAENIGGEHVTGLMDLDNSVEFARMKLNKALGQ